jgi:hypothetical protein
MRGEEIGAPTINYTRVFRLRKWPLPIELPDLRK